PAGRRRTSNWPRPVRRGRGQPPSGDRGFVVGLDEHTRVHLQELKGTPMVNHRNCQGMHRRDCLQLGLGALIGGGLVDALRLVGQSAPAASQPRQPNTSCILIWMDGGPTHYETFDPKPEAPVEIRGDYEPIATKT